MSLTNRARIALLLAIAAAPAAVRGADAMQQAVLGFPLTSALIEKMGQAYRNLAKVAEEDPGLVAKMQQQDQSRDRSQPQTVEQVVKQMEAGGPKVTGAISGAGLTPRDFIVGQMAIAQAAMGVEMAKQGIGLPEQINKGNVAFAQKNEAALKALLAEMQKMARAGAARPAP